MTPTPEQLISEWRRRGNEMCPWIEIGQLPRDGWTARQTMERVVGVILIDHADRLEAALKLQDAIRERTPMSPQRIQRKRTKGWRMPVGACYVGRPTKWGNPFCVVDVIDAYCGDEQAARADCVRSYRHALLESDDAYIELRSAVDAMRELRGKDLACWCRLDQPCHADVLLELANR